MSLLFRPDGTNRGLQPFLLSEFSGMLSGKRKLVSMKFMTTIPPPPQSQSSRPGFLPPTPTRDHNCHVVYPDSALWSPRVGLGCEREEALF